MPTPGCRRYIHSTAVTSPGRLLAATSPAPRFRRRKRLRTERQARLRRCYQLQDCLTMKQYCMVTVLPLHSLLCTVQLSAQLCALLYNPPLVSYTYVVTIIRPSAFRQPLCRLNLEHITRLHIHILDLRIRSNRLSVKRQPKVGFLALCKTQFPGIRLEHESSGDARFDG